jgi:hypothetical protein
MKKHPKVDELYPTAAGARFIDDSLASMGFNAFVSSADFHSKIAQLYEKFIPPEIAVNQKHTGEFRDFERLFREMLYCRMVDNFLTYIAELIAEILTAKPAILRSQEKLEIAVILDHADFPSLVSTIADRKVRDLSYLKVQDLFRYISERLGIELFESDAERNELIRIVEFRNLITHSRAVVNATSRKRLEQIGVIGISKVEITEMQLSKDSELIIDIASNLDVFASEKFNLKLNQPKPESKSPEHECAETID